MAERVHLTGAEVIAIQRRQSEEYRSSHGLPDQAALESAVFLPQAGYCGELTEEAAALLESLLNHHAFCGRAQARWFCCRSYSSPGKRL